MIKKEKLEIRLRDCVRDEMERKEIEVIAKIKTNPRAFYTYAKKHCKTYCSVGPLTDENNELQTDPTKMCNILQKQYQKPFSEPNSGIKKTQIVKTLIVKHWTMYLLMNKILFGQ